MFGRQDPVAVSPSHSNFGVVTRHVRIATCFLHPSYLYIDLSHRSPYHSCSPPPSPSLPTLLAMVARPENVGILDMDIYFPPTYLHQHQEGAIVELARDSSAHLMTTMEILDDDIYLGAESCFNLFTVRKNSEGTTDEFTNCFRHGSLATQLPYSDIGQIPTVMFGTVNGVMELSLLSHMSSIYSWRSFNPIRER